MNRMVDEHGGIAPWDERPYTPAKEEIIHGYGVDELLSEIGPDDVADWLLNFRPYRQEEKGRHYNVIEYGSEASLHEEMAAWLREAGWTVIPPAESDQKDSGKIITPVKSETASAEKRPKGQNDEAA